jgi:hypothetical protein
MSPSAERAPREECFLQLVAAVRRAAEIEKHPITPADHRSFQRDTPSGSGAPRPMTTHSSCCRRRDALSSSASSSKTKSAAAAGSNYPREASPPSWSPAWSPQSLNPMAEESLPSSKSTWWRRSSSLNHRRPARGSSPRGRRTFPKLAWRVFSYALPLAATMPRKSNIPYSLHRKPIHLIACD